jgi:mRNA interferase RelE/StbE
MYRIEIKAKARRALDRMPRDFRERVMRRVETLAADPFAAELDVKKLRGFDGFRLRVGDWRVIYQVDQGRIVVLVLAVAPRGDVYDRL